MIPPTPEASGEPLKDAQIEKLLRWAEGLGGHYTRMVFAVCRELQQRRAASLPAAQGADVAALQGPFKVVTEDGGTHSVAAGWRLVQVAHTHIVAHRLAALDARLSPPQAGETASGDVDPDDLRHHYVGSSTLQGAPEASVEACRHSTIRVEGEPFGYCKDCKASMRRTLAGWVEREVQP